MLKEIKVFREIEHNGKMIKIQFHTKKPNSKCIKKISKHKTDVKKQNMYAPIWISNIRLIWIDFQVNVFSLFKDIEGNRNSFKKKKNWKISIDYHQKQLSVPSVNEILTSKVQEKGKWKSLSCVWLFLTPWTEACQAPLSMEFSRPEYWTA